MGRKSSARVSVLSLLIAVSQSVLASGTVLTWHGHSAFEVVTPKGTVLMIDPWLTNPQSTQATEGEDPLAQVKRLDYIVVTHSHYDHVGDAVALARRTGARLVANADVGLGMAKALGYPAGQMGPDTLGKLGERMRIADGEITVVLTPVAHAVTMGLKKPDESAGETVYGTLANGAIIMIENGPTIYHSGDTAFFEEMQSIGGDYSIDVALVNIDPSHGLGPDMAARVAEAVGAKLAVPHHYGTFPVIAQDPEQFLLALQKRGIEGRALSAGDAIRFEGNKAVP